MSKTEKDKDLENDVAMAVVTVCVAAIAIITFACIVATAIMGGK